MNSNFQDEVEKIYQKYINVVSVEKMFRAKRRGEVYNVNIQEDLIEEFFKIIDKVTFGLMEEEDNFYGYFLFQMEREIRFDITSATGVNFKNAKYYIYFNPVIFLKLNIKQMESTIKHEILHILSMHLIRAKELRGRYSIISINLAMDIVVNQYLDNLPPYSITLMYVNNKYNLELEPYKNFEYYVTRIQDELNLLEEDKHGEVDDMEMENSPYTTHDMWLENNDIDNKTLRDFTEKYINNATKGKIPSYISDLINNLSAEDAEISWQLYLKKILGRNNSKKKKTITRKNRRQPDRLDLKGELKKKTCKIFVAFDESGSISNEEFRQAVIEVLDIVKKYREKITIIECDREIKRVYEVQSEKDIKNRVVTGGGTRFTPVFEYANKARCDLLIYFTDGKGEKNLEIVPKSYRVIWVISGVGDELSVEKPYGIVKKLKKINIIDDNIDLKDLKTDGYSMNNQEPIL